MVKKYKIFAEDVEFSYTSKELTNWRTLTYEEKIELSEFISRMADNPNPEDACFHFDDPEELYWPKLTPEERENVRKAIEPHIIKVK
ncbi:hypothetical protein [Ligilactobacillus murinus]|jgi:predicted Fe-S protein YdhL (DUF1289 family)|uniref:hypothetical protein n=1 Tax=Ligilactobacillus murinus TaxID=1622 RepID=UPI0010947493|nr:hypothetical protein [Ligilactobacillus murinus]TGY53632.1 hypothetical protein E5341_02055 [Ligilactobacillus murinus]